MTDPTAAKTLNTEPEKPKQVWILTIPELQQLGTSENQIPKEIEVLSFSHDSSINTDPQAPKKLQINVSDLNIVKYADSSSPLLWQALQTKRTFKEIILSFKYPTRVYRYELKNAQISSISSGGTLGNMDYITESISLSFEEMKMLYTDAHSKNSAVITAPK